MTITKTLNGTEMTIAPEGRLDTLTAPELRTVVENELSDVTDLTMDFAKLDFISSAGLRIMLTADKTMSGKGTFRVINASQDITELFYMTGLDEFLE